MRRVESLRSFIAAACVAGAAFVFSSGAGAQQIDYDPARPAVLRKCDEPLHRGRVRDRKSVV